MERIFSRKTNHSPDKVPQILTFEKSPMKKPYHPKDPYMESQQLESPVNGHRSFNRFSKDSLRNRNGQPRTPGIWGKSAILKSFKKKKKPTNDEKIKWTQKKQRQRLKKRKLKKPLYSVSSGIVSLSLFSQNAKAYDIPAKRSSNSFLPAKRAFMGLP